MNTTSLPEKYRPQSFDDLIGQSRIQTTLKNAIDHQTIAPAYLFHGTRGTGKTTSARIFAKALNCHASKQPTSTPCQTCESCRKITAQTDLDVSEINAADNNGVDAARELMERSAFAPIESRFKIFILDEAHSLTPQAQNALLTTLESPPPRVVFILCTTDPQKLLKTILSRCTRFEFHPIRPSDIEQRLADIAEIEKIDATSEALNAIARSANGGLRDALTLMNQLKLAGKITPETVAEAVGALSESETIAILKAANRKDFYTLLTTARSLIDNHKTPSLIVSTLMQTLNDLLILKASTDPKLVRAHPVSVSGLNRLMQTWSIDAIEHSIEALHHAEERLRTSNQSIVWLESSLIGLTNISNRCASNHENSTEKTEAEVWQTVIQKAGDRGNWLTRIQLVRLSSTKAVLQVESKLRSKVEKNQSTITRYLQTASGYSALKLVIKEPS
jgi:DNA polymerase III subunit gamma/tau